MQNRITELFTKTPKNLLSIFYTAGFPQLNDTLEIALELQKAGVDLIEIGMPFSDPLADGPIIQHSSQLALQNGMNLAFLFEQLKNLRKNITIPVLLMGYLNPVLQFGIKKFFANCHKVGIDGLILPDLPLKEYTQEYKELFTEYNLSNIFLITPQTSIERIKQMDENTTGFLYAISSASTTGANKKQDSQQVSYFQKLKNQKLKNPFLIGFNIKDAESFRKANLYASGAIIGSAFIQELQNKPLAATIKAFITKIRS